MTTMLRLICWEPSSGKTTLGLAAKVMFSFRPVLVSVSENLSEMGLEDRPKIDRVMFVRVPVLKEIVELLATMENPG